MTRMMLLISSWLAAQVFISISGSELTAFNGTFSSKVAQAGAGGVDIMVGMDTELQLFFTYITGCFIYGSGNDRLVAAWLKSSG